MKFTFAQSATLEAFGFTVDPDGVAINENGSTLLIDKKGEIWGDVAGMLLLGRADYSIEKCISCVLRVEGSRNIFPPVD